MMNAAGPMAEPCTTLADMLLLVDIVPSNLRDVLPFMKIIYDPVVDIIRYA